MVANALGAGIDRQSAAIHPIAVADNESTMALNWETGELAEGLACYRNRQFFETHEHWESVWMRSSEPERTFLQSLIHIAVAFHHLQQNNPTGAIRQLKRALRKLEDYPPEFGRVDVDAVRCSIAEWLTALEGATPTASLPYPIIR